jgi:hypothetical protein
LKKEEPEDEPAPQPQRKTVWSNSERLVKSKPVEAPAPEPQPYPRDKLFLKKSRKMAKGKLGIGDRAKRDFTDMIEEYRARAREERSRNEHSEQFQ